MCNIFHMIVMYNILPTKPKMDSLQTQSSCYSLHCVTFSASAIPGGSVTTRQFMFVQRMRWTWMHAVPLLVFKVNLKSKQSTNFPPDFTYTAHSESARHFSTCRQLHNPQCTQCGLQHPYIVILKWQLPFPLSCNTTPLWMVIKLNTTPVQ